MDGTINTPAPRRRLRRLWLVPAVGAIAGAAAIGGLASPARGVSSAAPSDGLICNYGTSNGREQPGVGHRTFTLTALRGQIMTADLNQVPMWGYALGTGANANYQYPSPFLCAETGDDVTVILHNDLGSINTVPLSTSLMFPGQTDVTANGIAVSTGMVNEPAPAGGTTPVSVATLVDAVAAGGTITYNFTAGKPGSYLYTSGTDLAIQEQMGLFGGLIVRPGDDVADDGTTSVSNTKRRRSLFGVDTGSDFQADRENVQMFSDVDPALHEEINAGRPFDIRDFTVRYWFINGRSMPDTVAPNNAGWLPDQPYGSLLRVMPFNPIKAQLGANTPGTVHSNTNHAYDNLPNLGNPTVANNPTMYDQYPAGVRLFNASETAHPFHPHAADTTMLGVDANQLGPNARNSYLQEISPGSTIDATWQWVETHGWDPVSNPVPVPVQDFRDTRYTGGATWYGGTPYLGVPDELPDGNTSFNECGEYYHVAHSHAVNEATTYGAAMGGMLTLYRIDPPGKENCK